MSTSRALGVALLVAGLLGARLQAELINEIRQHNPAYEPPGTYYQLELDNQVRILEALAGETFEFEAVLLDAGQYVGRGIINRIIADAGAGDVTITVVGHDLHPYGAEDIGEINLSAVAGTIGALDISGDFGDVGPMLASNAGALSVGGEVVNDIDIDNEITALIIGGDLAADLTCNTLLEASFGGSVLAGATLSIGTIHALDVAGDFAGVLFAAPGSPPTGTGLQDGPFRVRGHLLSGGAIYFGAIDTACYEPPACIQIDGDVQSNATLAFLEGLPNGAGVRVSWVDSTPGIRYLS
jgi:hypothetical protein